MKINLSASLQLNINMKCENIVAVNITAKKYIPRTL